MSTKSFRVLVTSGGTREAIDGVRTIVNTSTGATGAAVAEAAAGQGAHVVLLHGAQAILPASAGIETIGYVSFADLKRELELLLGDSPSFDVIIHAAAVSDFFPKEIVTDSGVRLKPQEAGKLSSGEEFTIKFSRNPKLIDLIAALTPDSLLVGFKLTNTEDKIARAAAVARLAARGVCDLIVHNDLHAISGTRHDAAIYDRAGQLLYRTAGKGELARTLMQLCRETIHGRYA